MPRIGQILCAGVSLSDHDIEEILHEQKMTRQRFGEVALALGKVKPEDVWSAWLTQAKDGPIDLGRLPIDAAAIAAVPSAVAWTHGVVPVRVRGNALIVAVADAIPFEAVAAIEHASGRRVTAVICDAVAVGRALQRHYPMPSATAA